MKKILCISGLLFLLTPTLSAKIDLDSLFNELDSKIKHNDIYIELKDLRIDDLKAEKKKTNNTPQQLYAINQSLYKEYKSYISDSAISYLNRNLDIAYSLKDQYKINETSITLSNLFVALGMYLEASKLMGDVKKEYFDNQQRIEYYSTYRYLYSGLRLYSQNMRNKDEYWKMSHAYMDTLFMIAPPNSEEYLRIKETKLRENGKIAEALEINDRRLELTKIGTTDYAFVTFHRSLLYRQIKDLDSEKKYLILSAISDIQSAIKDNASIPILANMLMQEGDVDRAYAYVRFSLENINDYNTRVRSSEILNIQTIIDKAYQQKNEEQKQKLRFFLIVISLLSVLLIISICYVYKQMRKGVTISKRLKESNLALNTLNQKLHNINIELQQTNSDVSEANQIKEEYIGYFLGECLKYIDKLDAFRKMVNKKIQDKQVENLYKLTKDNILKEEELKELFTNFDTIFLHLFPDFIEKFNSLLLDEEHIILKKDEVLNTEFRIYALIRLGINDSNKIASFLGYSVNTIYNYRAKVKNKAKIAREDFEWAVRRIGTFRK
ncbi:MULTISPECIES: DUF6377 domain-containing protein [unclassified Dysgonomonas]|uniref:DUF6377 domain-containing protein n=1 Tax=unclassified Dysgonomonas TaxID=2630389 RepID=UPI000682A674|nr:MULTISPECIES: DUF6377 domain-containing protein [unclassified Dysgonomonas]MBD8346815.1 transcriptional regulator [Dysgonomonas sp. HGC4]MBF0577316.1 transcriptional regulator [Dysgonomonas sp. GY617]